MVRSSGRDHHIDKIVSVYITRTDIQTARGSGKINALCSTAAELKADPVMIVYRSVSALLHGRDIGSAIPVKIFDRELGYNRSFMRGCISRWGDGFKADRNNRCEYQ